MGVWAYFAPLWLGTLVTALVMALGWNGMWELPGWQVALLLVSISPAVGLLCQIEMVAAQGAFGQVLPVPVGRSVRGPAAVLAGVLLLAAVNSGIVGGLFVVERAWSQATAVGVFSGAALIAALVTYAWSLPAAVRDFSEERGV